jgi:hypothetical protein
MSFSLGPSGGMQDPEILRLLAQLTTLINENRDKGGAESPVVLEFIDKHRNTTFVDERSQHMHTFGEVAEAMAPLIHGLKNNLEDKIPGDGWQSGSAEKIFDEKDPNEPADWWKT